MTIPSIRELTDHVSYWEDTGYYTFYWQGDELVLKATNDEDAKKEAIRLQFDLESE